MDDNPAHTRVAANGLEHNDGLRTVSGGFAVNLMVTSEKRRGFQATPAGHLSTVIQAGEIETQGHIS
jgi:hypothetical protein